MRTYILLSLLIITSANLTAESIPVDWKSYDVLSVEQQQQIPIYCAGTLVEPDWQKPVSNSIIGSTVKLRANQLAENPDRSYTATGKVELIRGSLLLQSDRMQFNPATGIGSLHDNILIRAPGMSFEAATGEFDITQKQAELFHAVFGLHEPNLSGTANAGFITENGYRIKGATITRCDPSNPAWHIRAHRLRVDQEKGIAVATNTSLYLGPLPIFYTPYISFPIDNRRKTGFLIPDLELGLGRDESRIKSFRLPYYWNISPGLDNTTTYFYQNQHNEFVENETRFLGRYYNGQITIGGNSDADRWLAHIDTEYRASDSQTLFLDADFYSDQLVPVDFERKSFDDDKTDTDFNYTKQELKYTSRTARRFITTDIEHWQPTNSLAGIADKPYARAPGINFTYKLLNPVIKTELQLDTAFFTKYLTSDQRTELEALSKQTNEGLRESIQVNSSAPINYEGWQLKPGVLVIGSAYQTDSTGNSSYSPASWINAGAYLDIARKFQLTDSTRNSSFLRPRIVYNYSPYTDQYHAPVFDAKVIDFDTSQLFNIRRFSGLDRSGDMNRLSVGIDYQHQIGAHQKINLSTGQILRLGPERLGLNKDLDTNNQNSNSLIFNNIHWQITSGLSFNATLNFDTYSNILEDKVYKLAYRGKNNSLFNIESVDQVEDNISEKTWHFSALVPFATRWGLVVATDYDLTTEVWSENLLGLEYDSCCWNLRLLSKIDWYNNDSNDPVSSSVFVQVHLKGLGQNIETLDELLTDHIPGYAGRIYP